MAEDYQGNKDYDAVVSDEKAINRMRVEKRQSPQALRGWLASIVIWSFYTPPKLSLDLGQSQSFLLSVPDLTSASPRIIHIPHHPAGMHTEGFSTNFQLQPCWYASYV